MKGITFYLEHYSPQDKREGNHNGNVVAVFRDAYTFKHNEVVFDAVGAVFFYRNAPVSSTRTPQSYLRKHCKRISESRAREVHPRLFEWLEEPE